MPMILFLPDVTVNCCICLRYFHSPILDLQVITPSAKSPFDLCGISIPGGTLYHGARQLSESKFSNVSYILLALGTNDVLSGAWKFRERYEKDLIHLTEKSQRLYPEAKVRWL